MSSAQLALLAAECSMGSTFHTVAVCCEFGPHVRIQKRFLVTWPASSTLGSTHMMVHWIMLAAAFMLTRQAGATSTGVVVRDVADRL
jgi:hypothetical protein